MQYKDSGVGARSAQGAKPPSIYIQGVRKVWEGLYISSDKVLFKKVKIISKVIFNEEFNGDLQFDVELNLQDHFKVNFVL